MQEYAWLTVLRERRKRGEEMLIGRLFVALVAATVFLLVGAITWYIWNRIYLNIKRRNKVFDIENEAYKKMRRKIKEDKEE